jgi:glycosyltransferase involved in cell wall biosynthesis
MKSDRFDYAFYVPSFMGGGAERNCVLLANELCLRGSRVCFIVDRASGPNRSLLADGVVVDELGGAGHVGHIPRLRRVLSERAPRVIYAQIGLSPIKYLLASLLLRPRATAVVVYHGIYDPTWLLGGKLSYWFAPMITRLFDSVVAVSSDLKDHLVKRFHACARAVSVIHNPIDLDLLNKMAAAEGKVALPPRPCIVAMGRMVPQKDFSTLINAYALIAGEVPHDLLILGEGPLRESLVAQAAQLGLADRIRMPGYLDNPYPLVRHADLFVLSSVHEAFGNVLVEALALGVPVASTNCPGGPREILADGRYGTLCALGNPRSLADAMLAALRAPHDREMGKRRAMDFSVARIADRYAALAMIEHPQLQSSRESR